MDEIIRKVVTSEAAENRRNRHKRQKRHRKLLKEQVFRPFNREISEERERERERAF